MRIDVLRKTFSYDPNTGIFTWKISTGNRIRVGDKAGCVDYSGYVNIALHGKIHKGHRLAWMIHYGENPRIIDHVNGDKSDNRIVNLRTASPLQNSQNRKGFGKVPYKGVCLSSYSRDIEIGNSMYRTSISLNGKRKHIGNFPSAVLAALAYDEMAKAKFGEFAKLNFPNEV